MKNRRCNFCLHYSTCKFVEELRNTSLFTVVEWQDERAFDRWKNHFAKYCTHFNLDDVEVETMIKCGLMSIFDDSSSSRINKEFEKK
jgi:heme-degrading monooxygenase HmoA